MQARTPHTDADSDGFGDICDGQWVVRSTPGSGESWDLLFLDADTGWVGRGNGADLASTIDGGLTAGNKDFPI